MEKGSIILILIILGLIAALFLDLGGIIGSIFGGASEKSASDALFLKFSNVRFDHKTNLFSAELKNMGSENINIIMATVHYVDRGAAYEEQINILIKPHSSKTIELKLEKEPHRVSVTMDKNAIVVLWHEGSCEGSRSC